jgi:hypothetical protein
MTSAIKEGAFLQDILSTNVIQRREEGAGMSDPASTRLSFVRRGPRGGASIQFIIRPRDFIAPPGDEDQDETAIQGVTKVGTFDQEPVCVRAKSGSFPYLKRIRIRKLVFCCCRK